MSIKELVAHLKKMQDRGDISLYNVAMDDWFTILNKIEIESNKIGDRKDEEISSNTAKNLELVNSFCEHLRDYYEIEIDEHKIVSFFEP